MSCGPIACKNCNLIISIQYCRPNGGSFFIYRKGRREREGEGEREREGERGKKHLNFFIYRKEKRRKNYSISLYLSPCHVVLLGGWLLYVFPHKKCGPVKAFSFKSTQLFLCLSDE